MEALEAACWLCPRRTGRRVQRTSGPSGCSKLQFWGESTGEQSLGFTMMAGCRSWVGGYGDHGA